jgi:hypothetical protein
VPPTHRETVEAYDEAMRRFEATWQEFGRAVETLWLALCQAGPSDIQLARATEVLVFLTKHLQTLLDVMERDHESQR